MAEQLDRFRSFSERYIIERAGKFEIGREQEQAWLALQDAKQIYGMIADASRPIVQDLNPPQVSPLTGLPHGPTGPTGVMVTARDAAKAPPWQPAKAPPPAMTSILQQMASKLKGY